MFLLLKVLSIVLPVFFIIGLGYVFASLKKINLEPVIEILLYITIPALIVSSLTQKKILLDDLATVSLTAGAVVIGTGVISLLYLGLSGRTERKGFYLVTMFMNSGNIPFPIALFAFGLEGLALAVLYYITVGALIYTLGVYIAKGKGGMAEIFKLPLIYASAVGIGLNLLDYKLPQVFQTTVDMLGWATIPIMQISLGYELFWTKLTEVKTTLAASLIRIAGGFAIALFITEVFAIGGLPRKIILLTSIMPSAIINLVISRKYNVEGEVVASTIALTTLVSIAAIPALLLWIM